MVILQRKNEEYAFWLIILAALFYTLWGVYEVYRGSTLIFDRFFSAGVSLLVLVLYKPMHLSIATLSVGFCALLLHHLMLYGGIYFGIPFDHYVHFVACFAIALAIYEYLSSLNIAHTHILLFAVFISAGIASIIEIVEFAGFHIAGEGEGLLFYGTGDYGGWANTSWDLICNTGGATIGALLMFFLARTHHTTKVLLFVVVPVLLLFMITIECIDYQVHHKEEITTPASPQILFINEVEGHPIPHPIDNFVIKFTKSGLYDFNVI